MSFFQSKEFEDLLQDVSARVIQAYWREFKSSAKVCGQAVCPLPGGDHQSPDILTERMSCSEAESTNCHATVQGDSSAAPLFQNANSIQTCEDTTQMKENLWADSNQNLPQQMSSANADGGQCCKTSPAAVRGLPIHRHMCSSPNPTVRESENTAQYACRISAKVQSIMSLLQNAEKQDLGVAEGTGWLPKTQEIDIHNVYEAQAEAPQYSACDSASGQYAELAESVYCEFKQKIKELRSIAQDKESTILKMSLDQETLKAQHKQEVSETVKSHLQHMEQQKREHESDLAQRLQFIEALLHDKDALSSKYDKLLEEMKDQQVIHQKEIEALKQRWSAELKKQKETWQTGERARRDIWQAEKKKQITEMTAKAMEPKILSMTENYNAEVTRLKEKIHMHEKMLEEHEKHSMQLRDRLLKEREDAVEKERMMAHTRLLQEKEKRKIEVSAAAEKYASALEQEKKEMQGRLDSLASNCKLDLERESKAFKEKIENMKEQAERDKTTIEQQHQRTIARVREECGAERDGWKEAIREKAERQMKNELDKFKRILETERDEEIQLVLNRLEEEKRELHEEIAKKDASSAAARQEAAQALRMQDAETEKKLKLELAAKAQAVEDAKKAQEHASETSIDLERKLETIRYLEDQADKARQDQIKRDKELLENNRAKEESFRHTVEAFVAEKAALLKEVENAKERAQTLKQHHQAELERVEIRVKETLSNKDAKIRQLQLDIKAKQTDIQCLKETLMKQKSEIED